MPTPEKKLSAARKFHQAGALQQAEKLYRQVLQAAPANAAVHFELANALKQQGRLDEAAASYQLALRHQPNLAPAHNNLGNLLVDQNQLERALVHFQQALRLEPRYAEAHNNLGIALKKLGRLEEAAASYHRALVLKPDFDRAHSNLGNVLQEQGQIDKALASYRQALRCNPRLGAVYLNLGTLLRGQGKLEEAIACAQQAVQLQPQRAEGLLHLGMALQEQGHAEEAVSAYRQALQLQPDCAEPHYNLGGVFASKNQLEEAAAHFRKALQLKPHMAEAHTALSHVLGDRDGNGEAALACLEQALQLRPSDWLRAAVATCLPVIYQSLSELERWRRRLEEQVCQLREHHVRVDLTDEPALNLFYLAYQGLNDRDLQGEIAQLYRRPTSEVRPPRSKGPEDKIHLGLLSSFFRRHTIGLLMGGLVKELSRQVFSVTVLSAGRYEDEVASFFKQHADRYVEVPRQLPAARRLINDQQLDVLLYTDVGMDPVTSTLAFTRLAPVQCATWGHPVTTGIDTIDYFISSEALETDQAKDHYTETLVQLKSLPIYYYRPELPEPRQGRADFGLVKDAHVYACPQSLFKIHPQFDEILGGILRGDPQATVLMGWAMAPRWEQLLRQRFAATLPDVVERIRFLPDKLNRGDFLNLMAVVDVLLDPLHFGGGNTSYEGLAFGVPIVTLPSQFLRGRITFALYQQMQVLDCVTHSPQEYVECALRLGTDADYRESIRAKILAANCVLYENSAGVRELEQFFQQVVS